MNPHEFETMVQRYLRNECTQEEKDIVEKWFAGITQGNESAPNSAQKAVLRNKLWNKINVPVPASVEESKVRKLSYRTLISIAASVSVIAIASVIYFNYNDGSKESASTGKQAAPISLTKVIADKDSRHIILNDGSSVTLEPGSELSYPVIFGAVRQVQLKGEAFFEVARDEAHPFEVYSNEVITHVLGTSFRVKAYDNEHEIVVSVLSGKVSVSENKDSKKRTIDIKETVLLPNQQVTYQRASGILKKELVSSPSIVRKDPSMKMSYTNAPVTEIFEALGRLYAVDIEFDKEALASCTVTTDLSEEGLFERLEIICHAVNAKYSMDDAVIVIEGNGCN